MNEALISEYVCSLTSTRYAKRLTGMAFKDPFHTLSHPTTIQTTLPASALFCKFDPSGRFLATGRHNGAAEIWDMETKNAVRYLDGHVKPVTSVE